MRRTIACCLALLFLIMSCVPIFAEDGTFTAETPLEEEGRSVLNELTCEFDRKSGKILLGGTVRHEVLISHKQHRLEVYRVLPGCDVEEAIRQGEPLASAEIAVRFEFAIAVRGNLERFARYAVVLCSPDGERSLAAKPQYAGIESDYVYAAEDLSSFKGVYSSEISLGGNLGMGTAVLPVYLDRLLNDSSHGYVYSSGEQLVYFEKTYVEQLDRDIRSYSATGTQVYLQFLLTAGASELGYADGSQVGASYDMPNVFSEHILSLICAGSEFLAERYSSYQSGRFHGVIVGQAIDEPLMNYSGTLPLDRYSELYGLYLFAVAYSVRVHQPSIDIVIPFGSHLFEEPKEENNDLYSATELLESILMIQDHAFSFPFRCSTMVVCSSDDSDQNQFSVQTAANYSSYLRSLQDRFESAPSHYMIRWDIPYEMSANDVCLNYVERYYRFICDPMVSSFVVSFYECENNGVKRLTELAQILRWIDTEKGLLVTAPLVSMLEPNFRDAYITNTNIPYAVRTMLQPISKEFDQAWRGNFSYFDFSSGNVEDWFAGSSCGSVKTEYGQEGKRVLRGTLEPTEGHSYGELLCLYEYEENFSHTPYLSIRLGLAEESGDLNGLYQVMITLGNEKYRSVVQTLVKGGDIQTIGFDMSAYPADQRVQYIKISVRQVEGTIGAFSIRLYDLIGYSEVLSSEELDRLVQADRMSVRNTSENVTEQKGNGLWWIFGAVVLVIAVAVGILLCVRRDEEPSDEKDKKEQ